MNYACIDARILLTPEFQALWFECYQMGKLNNVPYTVTPSMVLGWVVTIWTVIVEFSKNDCITMLFEHIDYKVEFDGFARCLEEAGWLERLDGDQIRIDVPCLSADRN